MVYQDASSKDVPIWQTLRRDILVGRIPSGSPLSEHVLATVYGTSKTPVREALRHLVQEGLLMSVPRRGYFVRTLSVAELRGIFAVRLLVEGFAAEEAARHRKPSDLDQLRRLADRTYVAGDADSYAEYTEVNQTFHLQVAAASGNAELVRHVEGVLYRMELAMTQDLNQADPADLCHEHQDLVTLIAAQDASAARHCMEAQIHNTWRRVLGTGP